MKRTSRALLPLLVVTGLLVTATPQLPADAAPPLPKGWTNEVLVRFAPGSDKAQRTKALRAAQSTKRLRAIPTEKRQLFTGTVVVDGAGDPRAVIAALQSRPDVEYAGPNRRVRAVSNDPEYVNQWNLSSAAGITLTPVQRFTGAGVTVAVIDSGKTNHPDLTGQFVGGYDFISDSSGADGNSGRDADPTDTGDYCDGEPSAWHGTAVAGTIAALRDNGRDIAGVAPGAKILPVRVLGQCGGIESDVIDAIAWASGATVSGVPTNTHPARVINLSLSTVDPAACSPDWQQAITTARSRGSIVVTAAGNVASAAQQYAPGNCAGVVNVAASTSTQQRASYSNYGTTVDLAAPGGDPSAPLPLLTVNSSTTNNGSYGVTRGIGTSFAAPQVSAVAAMLWSQQPGLTGPQVESMLASRARPASSCQGCGAGILDATRTLAPVLTGQSWAATPLAGGTTVRFTGIGFSQITSVTVGGLALTNLSVTSDTQFTGTMPAHLAPGPYVIRTVSPAGTTAVGRALYVDVPRVVALSATGKPAGTVIRITGRGFLPGMTADVGGVAATVTAVESPTSALVRIPAGTTGGRGIVHVTTSQGTSSGAKGAIFTWG
ncbi:S8 family serine peptidase [Aestuariimicrobium soli]|uniref:S8 family serine peptidase n=1 Tax=Aestuariimicrobium soli TaxID=2035834 RepID=UPI003EBA286A